ncbi:MAG: response regulator [Anaerolineae bacterium]|nr:response regulator [Gloeobacterales cyanobacterium ES-bin-313]
MTEVATMNSIASLRDVRILVVDDDQESQLLFAEVLSYTGAIVSTASSGMEALSLIGTTVIDVLVSDLAMPSMSGFEVIRRLRAESWSGLAITVSAYCREKDVQESLESGFDDYFPKPVNIVELVERIAALHKSVK